MTTVDFFISYTGTDRRWAEWIAWMLEEAGYTTTIQAWDFRPGADFVLEMDRAAKEAAHTIAVLSDAYLKATFTQPEWAAAFARDATGAGRKLVPLRIDSCQPEGLLGQIVYIDLAGLTDEAEAKRRLLDGVGTKRAKPTQKPGFPQPPPPPPPGATPGPVHPNAPPSTAAPVAPTSGQGQSAAASGPAQASPPSKEYDVFLSHSHADAAVVEELGKRLEDEEGLRVWLDKWVLIPGQHWQPAMARALKQAASCAVFVGAQASRGWFQEEIQRALDLQAADPSYRVIPVLLPGADMSVLEGFVKLRTWVDFRTGLGSADAFYGLICGIRGVPPGRLRASPTRTTPEDRILQKARGDLERIGSLRDMLDNTVFLEAQRKVVSSLILGGQADE